MGRGRSWLSYLLKSIDWSISRAAVGGGISVGLLFAVMFTEVILRKLFNSSLLVAEELAGYFLAALVCLCLASVHRAGNHISISFAVGRMPFKVRKRLMLVWELVTLGILMVLLWAGSWLVWDSYVIHSHSYTPLRTPMFVPYLIVPIGTVFFILAVVSRLSTRSYYRETE